MPDLRTLAIFVKVAEKRSFVRAATDLGISQSGVSNAIKRLEDQVDTVLLVRTTRHVGLTEDGAAFFERCRQALAAIDEAELMLKRAQVKPSGTLRIDVPLSFGRIKLVPLLRPFQEAYPDVRLRLTFTDRYIDLIEEGVDIAVRFGALQDSSLIARRLTATQIQYRSRAGLSRQTRPTEDTRRPCQAQLPRLRLARHPADPGMALHGRRQGSDAHTERLDELQRRRSTVRCRRRRLRHRAIAQLLSGY
jgi:LysR family transcriptional regulator, regulator for bpeEF and oprC